ncbi:hypothetical protein TrLO_g9077 [Triparma laevis f. longispina]|uniref:RING-type domain-containing protein n=1 Tax=Triparma laevis f. longispina TaxID=1714387 RepID=A0A9W7A2H5_9STRA|nr:hypothetical protein TrLO_g9077 [Triparma laevis f. longispina]
MKYLLNSDSKATDLDIVPIPVQTRAVPPSPPSSKAPLRTRGFPGCTKKGQHHYSKCGDIDYCSEKHQEAHLKYHKKICVTPQKKISAPIPSAPPVPLKGSVDKEEEYEDKCVICLVNVPDAQMCPCGHSAVYRECTHELMIRSQPCPICRKPISGFEVGVYSGSLGERGLWPTSARHFRELARNDGFYINIHFSFIIVIINEYFQKQFNGNEAIFLRWKEVFDMLEIEGGKGIYYTVRDSLEQQVLRITRSEDLVKRRALAKLCSPDFFEEMSLLVVAWRRILEVLELAMPKEKKVRGNKKKQQRKKKDPRKLKILDSCFALGRAYSNVEDFDDATRYFKRAKEGYEEQLGRDSEKELEATYCLVLCTGSYSDAELVEKFRDLVKRCERALGEENVVIITREL